jgi:cell volume regulation protein A
MAHWLGLIVPPRRGPVERVELELPGEVGQELVSYRVHSKSPAARGQRLPRWARPSLVIRDGKAVPMHKTRSVQDGDFVYLFTPPEQLPLIDKLFSSSRALEQDDRDFYGDLELSPDATVGQIADMYGLPLPQAGTKLTLRELLRHEFGGSCELGDRIRVGGVELIVRDVQDGEILSVGLALEPTTVSTPRLPLFGPPRRIVERVRRWWGQRSFRRWQRQEKRRDGQIKALPKPEMTRSENGPGVGDD